MDEDANGNLLLRITAYPAAGPPIAYEELVSAAGTIDVLHSTDGELPKEPLFRARDVRCLALKEQMALPRE